MNAHSNTTKTISKVAELLTGDSALTPESPESHSFQSILKQAVEEGETSITIKARQQQLANEIVTAIQSGDEKKLAELQAEFDFLKERGRKIAEQPFAQTEARLSKSSQDLELASSTLKPNSDSKAESSPIESAAQEESLYKSEESGSWSNPFGVTNEVWKSVTKNERIASALESMPEKATALYSETSPERKLELVKKLHEKTHVFLFTIDNREAFITGSVMGHNTFDYLQGSLDKKMNEAMEKGTASMDDLMREKSALSILKELSPDQREAYIQLLETETKTVAVN